MNQASAGCLWAMQSKLTVNDVAQISLLTKQHLVPKSLYFVLTTFPAASVPEAGSKTNFVENPASTTGKTPGSLPLQMCAVGGIDQGKKIKRQKKERESRRYVMRKEVIL